MIARFTRRRTRIRPRDHGYTDHQLWMSLPLRPQVADLSAVPTALESKLISGGEKVVNGTLDISHITLARSLREESAAFVGAIAAGATTVGGLAWLLGSHGALPADLLAPAGIIVAIVWLVCGVAAATLWRRARNDFSAQEIDTLHAAILSWPLSFDELAKYPNADVLRREWASAQPRPSGGGSAALVWREPRLVAVAHALADDIRTSKVWGSSELLDTKHLDGQIDKALLDISARAHRLWRLHAASEPATARESSPPSAGMRGTTDDAWAAVVQQVDQLADWRRRIADLDQLFSQYQKLVEGVVGAEDHTARLQQALIRDAGHGDDELANLRVESVEPTSELELVHTKMAAMVAYLKSVSLGDPATVQP